MNGSKPFSLNMKDFRSMGIYFAIIMATGLTASMPEVQKYLADKLAMTPELAVIFSSMLGVFLKKFLENNAK